MTTSGKDSMTQDENGEAIRRWCNAESPELLEQNGYGCMHPWCLCVGIGSLPTPPQEKKDE